MIISLIFSNLFITFIETLELFLKSPWVFKTYNEFWLSYYSFLLQMSIMSLFQCNFNARLVGINRFWFFYLNLWSPGNHILVAKLSHRWIIQNPKWICYRLYVYRFPLYTHAHDATLKSKFRVVDGVQIDENTSL